MSERVIEVGGPYFEDFELGQVLEEPPGVTLTEGYAAFHQALFGDRLRLPLDAPLCQAVTGSERLLANPSLVCNVAIGQTTYASQRVKGNLFYRGLVFREPVFIGDTLRTETRVVALRQNRKKPGREATGMVVLEMRVTNQLDETVLHFWRCPMIPCRDPDADTGRADSFDAIPAELALDDVVAAVPSGWSLDAMRELGGSHFGDLEVGTTYRVDGRETITSAPELVRLTLNLAKTHTDAGASAYNRRLVYGGHTISVASAQIARALPNLLTIVAWRRCSHTAPVFEGDILRTDVTVEARHRLEGRQGGGGLVDLSALVYADRGDQAPDDARDVKVLEWELIVLMA